MNESTYKFEMQVRVRVCPFWTWCDVVFSGLLHSNSLATPESGESIGPAMELKDFIGRYNHVESIYYEFEP